MLFQFTIVLGINDILYDSVQQRTLLHIKNKLPSRGVGVIKLYNYSLTKASACLEKRILGESQKAKEKDLLIHNHTHWYYNVVNYLCIKISIERFSSYGLKIAAFRRCHDSKT